MFESMIPSLRISIKNPRILAHKFCNNLRFQLVLRFNMENWAQANFILSSRKKNILVDRQNFGHKFKRESETGVQILGL